jgi:acyl-coenzyme A thioesterase PaaI-like protein
MVGVLGKFGFTAGLTAKLRRPVRIGVEVLGAGRVAKPGTRVVTTAVRLEQQGDLVFEADIDFVLVDERGAERLLGGPLPEAWRRFCR